MDTRWPQRRRYQANQDVVIGLYAWLKMTIMTRVTLLWGGKLVGVGTWTVAEAKAKFSEVIDKARALGPQTITRNGRTAAVVVASDEWERKTKRQGTLAEFFAASPLPGSGLRVKRLRGGARKTSL